MRIGYSGLYEVEDDDESLTVQEPEAARQVHAYDKLLKENMETALPWLIKNLLKIHAIHSEALPDSVQYTKEREPDVLKKITDAKQQTFVLQLELQLVDDQKMVYRMLDYYAMLYRKYEIPVRQHVIYIGEGKATMPDILTTDCLIYHYSLISLSSINYRFFLRSNSPEGKMLAILGDFGKENPEKAVKKILEQVIVTSKGDLVQKKHLNQLRILAQMRNLLSVNKMIMESLSKYFKEERDMFYIRGEEKGELRGLEKGKTEVVKNLLLETKFTIAKIASLANVTEDFVEKVKKPLITGIRPE
jgi:predicted transposase/invertase (TIGR01784 family)